MVNVHFISANRVRIYKEGEFLKTLTNAEFSSVQNTIDKTFIGDDSLYTLATTKEVGGSFTRDMVDEEFLETVLHNLVTTKFVASNYDDIPDTVQDTLTNASAPIDLSFTTPNSAGLILGSVTLNIKRVGSFEGGLVIEIWEGAAVTGTLKATLTIAEGQLETNKNTFVAAYGSDESGGTEVSLTANVAHTMRLKKSGTVSGSLQFYGPSAATDPYYAIVYETSVARQGNYTIDIVFVDNNNAEYFTFRDTGITFLSDGVTINPGDPIGETLAWRASHRTIV